MLSRQDQLHSYQYSLQRVVAALVTHDPDPTRSPFRRVGSTALVSLLIAVVALGGTAAYAAITDSGASKADKVGTLYIEKETGAQFVFYNGSLHPVLNYTSGLLIIGSANASIDRVPRRTVAKATLGPELGIPGAPDSLPATRDLTAAPWAVCSEGSGAPPPSLLTIGDALTGGTDLGPGALIVQEPNGRIFLVYGNRKFMIPDFAFVSTSFFWGDPRPVQVAAAWINALPTGPDLAPLPIMQRGEPSGVPGARNGELFRATDGADGPSQWAVALPDGAVVISEVQAKLLANVSGAITRNVTIAEFHTHASRRSPAGQALAEEKLAGHPATVPALLAVDQRLCLTVDPKDARTTVLVDPVAPQAGNPVVAAPNSVREIDAVRVKSGAGVLVEAVPSPTAPPGSGTISIVTDAGRRFPIVDAAARSFLGYERATVQRLPAELVAVLPEGPALDPRQAVTPLPAG